MNSFKFDGKKVYFSGKMVDSTTYRDSVERGELVPQITLNKLAKPEEEWTLLELEEIASKSLNQYVGDMSHNSVSLFTIYICVFTFIIINGIFS